MGKTSLSKLAAALSIAAAGLLVSSAALAVKVGPVEDPIRVIKILKGAPIVIGGYFVLSGADTSLGLDEARGVEVAIDDLGGTLVGHPIKLLKEDGQCNAEGGQTAATKLSANQQVVVVVGPSCSSEAVPGAPILWKQGISSIGVSSSSPVLTDPNRGPGYDGFLRIAFNDLLMGREMATYVKDVLKLEKVATIHDGSPYAEKLIRAFQRNYKEQGGEVCADEAIAPTDVDMRPVLTRIATCKPKWIYMPVFLAASGHIARQSKEISGLEGVTLVGTDVVITKDFLEAAGKASVGFQFATTALEDEAKGKGYGEMIAKYKAKFGEDPVGGFHHYGYDALMVAAKAIETVAKNDDDGNTYVGLKALRDALYATKGYVGLSGPVNCNQFGDCGFLKLAIYKFVSESKENFGIGKNPVRHYPEKFE